MKPVFWISRAIRYHRLFCRSTSGNEICIAGDYAVLENETGGTTEVALALLPDGIAEGTVLIFENFEYRIKENMP